MMIINFIINNFTVLTTIMFLLISSIMSYNPLIKFFWLIRHYLTKEDIMNIILLIFIIVLGVFIRLTNSNIDYDINIIDLFFYLYNELYLSQAQLLPIDGENLTKPNALFMNRDNGRLNPYGYNGPFSSRWFDNRELVYNAINRSDRVTFQPNHLGTSWAQWLNIAPEDRSMFVREFVAARAANLDHMQSAMAGLRAIIRSRSQ